ncbi:MAG: SprB repeat-containing protein [Chitinophagales bacterium]
MFVNVAGYSNLLCYGDTSGNIDITANGGVPPYSYAWNTGATTEDLSGLLSGTYTATVTDNNGCTATISQTLAEPVVLSSSVVGTNVLCYGTATGSADLTVTGGTQPYVFQWSTFEATEDISGLSGGLYYVVITDNNGCQTRDSVLINEPAIRFSAYT